MKGKNVMKKIFCAMVLLLAFANLHSKELVDVASGESHTLLLFKDGTIVSLGKNCCGQLGRETEGDGISGGGMESKRIASDKKFISVAAGYDHSLAISDDGALWGWGSNRHFQFGFNVPIENDLHPSDVKYKVPVQLDNTKKWKKVFAEDNISIGMTSDGRLWNISRECHEIEHPYGVKWKDMRIECFAEWDGTDYNFLLKDEKNRYWLYKMPLFSPDEPYTLFFNKDECFLDDAEDHLDEQLYPLIRPTDFFYMNGLSGIFKEGKKFTVWGSSVIDTEEFLNANRGSEGFGFHKIVEEQIQIDDKNIKKILCGQFLPEVTYLIEMDRMKNGPYTAFFYKDGSLRLFANGREYKIGKEQGIKKVFDGYNIIFQTKDERIFFIGYNLYDSLGDYGSKASENENNFFFCKEVK